MQKLKYIYKLLNARNYVIITLNDDNVNVITENHSDLEGAMLMAVTVKKTYDSIIKEIEKQAVDNGELRTLQALQKTIDKVKDGGE